MSGGKYSRQIPSTGPRPRYLPPSLPSGGLTPPSRSFMLPQTGQPKGKSTGKPLTGTDKAATSLPIRSIVFLGGEKKAGSGTIVAGGQFVLTNAHVVSDESIVNRVGVWYTHNEDEDVVTSPPDAYGEVVAIDFPLDLAVIKLLDPSNGSPITVDSNQHPALPMHTPKPALGSVFYTLGFPGVGGTTITLTKGVYSGSYLERGDEFYKTDAAINGGNSGGAAFDERWRFIGIPTATSPTEDGGKRDIGFGLIRPAKFAVPLIEEAKKRG